YVATYGTPSTLHATYCRIATKQFDDPASQVAEVRQGAGTTGLDGLGKGNCGDLLAQHRFGPANLRCPVEMPACQAPSPRGGSSRDVSCPKEQRELRLSVWERQVLTRGSLSLSGQVEQLAVTLVDEDGQRRSSAPDRVLSAHSFRHSPRARQAAPPAAGLPPSPPVVPAFRCWPLP